MKTNKLRILELIQMAENAKDRNQAKTILTEIHYLERLEKLFNN